MYRMWIECVRMCFFSIDMLAKIRNITNLPKSPFIMLERMCLEKREEVQNGKEAQNSRMRFKIESALIGKVYNVQERTCLQRNRGSKEKFDEKNCINNA